MPWVHLHVDTNGLVKACCDANITLGNLREKTIKEIWDDRPIRKFRQALLEGKRDRRCMSCYRKDDAGKRSMRTETLSKFADKLNWVNETDANGDCPSSLPVYLDIRFSNLCNLRCRTCWHGASSSWFEEAKTLKNAAASKAIINATPDNNALIDQLFDGSVQIEEIYFAGGEPLMMQEHYDLLQRLLTAGNRSIRLRYNTNLSSFQLKDQNVLDYWREFKNVVVSVSIDGLHQQAEYIRKGLIWDKFMANIQIIANQLPHVKLEIAPTVSVFNIIKLPDLHRHFVEKEIIGVNDIYLNVLSRPDYYSIKTLPSEVKSLAEANLKRHLLWLMKKNADELVLSEFQGIIQLMNQHNWSFKLPDLKKQLIALDQMRSESFAETFPELKRVLDLV